MDRMSRLDASFLKIEDSVNHMHIGSIAIFEGPAPPYNEFADVVASKLPQVPRFRQKVRFVPLDLGRPMWVDDPHFNLGYHLRHTALAPPGDDRDLRNLVGRIMSQQLDRHKPLWEMWMVEGLDGGHWAVVSKVHHSMVDGVSGTDLLAVTLDSQPQPARPTPDEWVPASEPSDARLLADSFVDLISHPYEQVWALRSVALAPWVAVGQVARRFTAWTGLGRPPLSSPLNGPIGPHRRWDWAGTTLADVKIVRRALGGTVNDVVLSVLTRGFRELLLERGEVVEDRVVRALVPVSLRTDSGLDSNRVSAMIAELPVGIDDPYARLETIRAQMSGLMDSRYAVAGDVLVSQPGFAPSRLLALGARAAAQVQTRNINTITTNVPGPQRQLYLCGRPMLQAIPFVPLGLNIPVTAAIFSYNGMLNYGITGDYDASADISVLSRGIEAGMSELLKLAEAEDSKAQTTATEVGERLVITTDPNAEAFRSRVDVEASSSSEPLDGLADDASQEGVENAQTQHERQINVWVGDPDHALDEPLVIGETYPLSFMVGGQMAASLVVGQEALIPRSDIPSEGLHTDWVVFSSSVEFGAMSAAVTVETMIIDGSPVWMALFGLRVPPEGDSDTVQVLATPRKNPDAHFDLMIYARSELYRRLRVRLALSSAEHGDAKAETRNVATVEQDSTRSPAAQLSLRNGPDWTKPTGYLSITVVGDVAIVKGDAYEIDDDGQLVSSYENDHPEWSGYSQDLKVPMDNVIASAERFRSKWEDYLNDIDPEDLLLRIENPIHQYDWGRLVYTSDSVHEESWARVATSEELHLLAVEGHVLYKRVFPRGSRLREIFDALPAGHRVDIDWPPSKAYVPHVPWGLMYVPEVPAPGVPIDPAGFVGLRFRVGYTSHNVPHAGKALGSVAETHGAHLLYAGADAGDEIGTEARRQRELWSRWANQVLAPTGFGDTLAELQQLIADPAPPPVSVVYLYCQSGGTANNPVLRFGPPSQPYDLRREDLDKSNLAGRPFVFANACGSTAADPYVANELEQIFFGRDCRAYLGTETKVPIPLASRFASVFFEYFYRRVDPAPIAAGEAVSQTRLFLWTNYRNIGGLFWAHVNTYELFMADDDEVRELRA